MEIRPAAHLWGKTVPETEDLLLSETNPKAKVACIGPAGERLVKVSIMNDKHRAAGRSGVGAVMGSKNLKAVVVRGAKEPTGRAGEDERTVPGGSTPRRWRCQKGSVAARIRHRLRAPGHQRPGHLPPTIPAPASLKASTASTAQP